MLVPMKPVDRSFVRAGEKGTVLLMVVAFLGLMGALMILGVSVFHTMDNSDLGRRTAARQTFLMHELASYAQRTDTLPCPASPAVSQTTAAFGFSIASTPSLPCGGTYEGIVPFRTLNLSQSDALDGWGRFMTYSISPAMADTSDTDPAAGTKIFMRCRREPWFQDDDPSSIVNEYPQKARFCCPSEDAFAAATDLKVYASAAALAANTPIDSVGRKAASQYYQDRNTEAGTTEVPGDTQGALVPVPAAVGNEDLFAVVIVSHGQNGIGAYLANGTSGRFGSLSSAGADEQTNIHTAPGTNYIDRAISTVPGTNYFDDVVSWRTQLTLMSELNNSSCYIPWR